MKFILLSSVFIQNEIIADVVCHTGLHFGPSTISHVINGLPCILILLILVFMRTKPHLML